MNEQETEVLRQLARSWNNLDVKYIERLLANNFIYESQWVLIPIKGKSLFLSYLNLKFLAIRSVMQNEQISITAELAFHPSLKNKPCIILTQKNVNGIVKVLLRIKIKQEKIRRINVCFNPNPEEAILSGEFPK